MGHTDLLERACLAHDLRLVVHACVRAACTQLAPSSILSAAGARCVPAPYAGYPTDMNSPHRPTPEDQGVPDHADDTSTAFRETDRPRFNDSPPAMPADSPQAVDEYGTTPAEERSGEPLDRRLAREEPEQSTQPAQPEESEESTDEAGIIPEVDTPEIHRTPEGGVPEGEFPDQP
ncbi:hypothetical protein JQS43_11930 [Natronosporangium hydrolyticum]|uniref:Uncharacterized protein n=1 Tax=Natronosporangium hydrolyticum TaxID=2811111 RepID=A0A895YGH6_9ACTN|nr:hypothetical protein [Natronosporangium hydrolyticum]QSB16917.1 hypothetical protein JQS43_11930 [Natronosporangium hydrolyticum]